MLCLILQLIKLSSLLDIHLKTSIFGIMCLCSMSHPERALTLAHYANKSTKLRSMDTCSGGSKNNYLHSVQRFLKCYKHFYDLTVYYDTATWSWNTSAQYEIVRDTLANTTILVDSKKTKEERQGPNKSAYMTDEQFAYLNAFTSVEHCLLR